MQADSRKIVIIEDEPDTAEMYAEMMRICGYQVEIFFGGKAAVSKIADQKPAAVILDIMMPDFSGLDVLNYMRADRNLSDIPVIIVSAKTLPDEIHEGLNAGADVYLTKPVAFNDLKNAIEEVSTSSLGGRA
jgi:two-component system alkaline phosphatase synthesis response regulator PhoP